MMLYLKLDGNFLNITVYTSSMSTDLPNTTTNKHLLKYIFSKKKIYLNDKNGKYKCMLNPKSKDRKENKYAVEISIKRKNDE